MINGVIPSLERVFSVITDHQSGLPEDMEASATHATLYCTEHAWHV